MKNFWVVGNGQSRLNFALNQISDPIIGCNAIHRDHNCDYYVAVDRRMVDEILNNEQSNNSIIYTRQDWIEYYHDHKNVLALPDLPFTGTNKVDKPFHWNSGPYAVLVAANNGSNHIHLLGFDLWSKTSFVNNIYKDTQNYAKHDSRKVSPDFWIHQLKRLFDYFVNIEFIQHQKADWQIPRQWKGSKNLTIKYDIV